MTPQNQSKTVVLGLRFSNSDYTWALLTGTQSTPVVSDRGRAKMPKGFLRPQALKWFCQEIETLITKHNCNKICIKKCEPFAQKGNAYETRVEHETTTFIVAGNHGIKAVTKKVNATIAKDLGQKGRAKYLKTTLDTSVIPDFDNRAVNERDAILAAWSELP